MYLFTCYIGVIGLLASDEFRTLYLVYSGASPRDLDSRDVWRILLLLNASPMLLYAGYESVVRLWPRVFPGDPVSRSAELLPNVLAMRLFAATAVAVACYSLVRTGAWQGVSAWADYNAYVYARFHLFDTLSFLEFVNLYTILPLAIACWALSERSPHRCLLAGTGVVVALQYALAQRRPMLTSLALIGVSAYAYYYLGRRPRRRLRAAAHLLCWFGVPVILYTIYTGLTLQTVIRRDSRPFQTIDALKPVPMRVPPRSGAVVPFHVDEQTIAAAQRNRVRSVIVYTLLAPLTRTSISAVAYPTVFPELHDFYRIDIGLDILGVGRMPEDNLVVYRVLWPSHSRGAIAAPYAFVLYSQGGMWIALAGSLVIGVLLALGWMSLMGADHMTVPRSIVAGVMIVLSVYLAVDSVRNSITVSYGFGWGFAVAGLAALVARLGVTTRRVETMHSSR